MFVSGLLFCALIFMIAPDAKASDAAVCLPGVVCATVTLPGRTVTLPRATDTTTVSIRVPAKTVTQTIPGPVSTVTIVREVAGKTSTVTSPSGQTGQARDTVTSTTTVTATRTDVRTVPRDRVVNLTRPGAVGISLGLLAVGVILALVVLYIMYRLGYWRADDQNLDDLKKLRDDLHNAKG